MRTPGEEVAKSLRPVVDQFGLSSRAYERILRVACTIADLEGAEGLVVHSVAEAVQYRSLDREVF